ncbi:MAG: J domain-containing protein, partial [Moraxellaceae bacterium]|nr:J domain-containing protein [Moraxellaceae bacterium]
REMMEDMLGEPLTDDESLETVQDVFRAGMERLREVEAAEQEARQQAQARKKKPGAAQLKAKADQQEAETTLRKVFRQLASALHPDRESDPDEHARKTTLMSEANAAYDRRDLVALLQIQLRTELTDTASIAKMAEEKIASLTLLLNQQVRELENKLHQCRHDAQHEFGLKSYETLNITNLHRSLRIEELSFQKDLATIQQDLQQIEDDKYFKRWLKDQNHLSETPPGNIFDDWNVDPFRGR